MDYEKLELQKVCSEIEEIIYTNFLHLPNFVGILGTIKFDRLQKISKYLITKIKL